MKPFQFRLMCLSLVLFVSHSAFAYILKPHTILNKTAENLGKGLYEFKQDLVLTQNGINIVVQEQWYITDAGIMFVNAKAPGFAYQAAYQNSQKIYRSNLQASSRKNLGSDFFDTWFAQRSSAQLAKQMQQSNILNYNILNNPRSWLQAGKTVYQPDSNIKLSRAGEGPAYLFAMGKTNNTAQAAIWIEQDQFLIRKIRSTSGAEFTADNYEKASGVAWPKIKNIYFKDLKANMRVKSFVKRTATPEIQKQINGQIFLSKEMLSADPSESNEEKIQILQSFYSKFR